jgi:hypothetical protein
MTLRRTLVLLLLVHVPILAQHPDFSGHWSVVTERTTAAPTWGQRVNIVQDAQSLNLERFIADQRDTATISLTGSESKNPTVLPGGTTATSSSKIRWEEKKMIIVTTTPREGRPTITTTRTIQLESDDILVIETITDSPGSTPKTTTVYRRTSK